MHHMQTRLGLDLLLGRRHTINPVLRIPRSTPKPREIQHAATEPSQFVFGDGPLVASVVRRVPRHPQLLLRDLEYARRAELYEAHGGGHAGVRVCVRRDEELALVWTRQWEGDEDVPGGGQGGEVGLVRGRGVEFELCSVIAAGRGCGGVGQVAGLEEGDEESGGPAGAED